MPGNTNGCVGNYASFALTWSVSSETLASVESMTGVSVTAAYVDKGYRGHDYTGSAEVHVAGQRNKNTSRSERRRRRCRSAVEPKTSHLKSDHRMDRCFLAGLQGNAINAVLAAANMRKLHRRFFYALICWLEGTIPPRSTHCIALQYAV